MYIRPFAPSAQPKGAPPSNPRDHVPLQRETIHLSGIVQIMRFPSCTLTATTTVWLQNLQFRWRPSAPQTPLPPQTHLLMDLFVVVLAIFDMTVFIRRWLCLKRLQQDCKLLEISEIVRCEFKYVRNKLVKDLTNNRHMLETAYGEGLNNVRKSFKKSRTV